MNHIAIVDDDPTLRNRLKAFLEKEGFRASAVGDGAGLRGLIETDAPDLVITDLQMPGEDGLSLTRFLRERTEIPVMILTGKGETIDRVVGLEMGADDYLSKPFSLRELLARIKVVLRRAQPNPPGDLPAAREANPKTDCLHFGDWTINFTAITLRNEKKGPVHLTTAEFRLLEALVRNPGRTLSRDRLIDAIADRDWEPTDRSIDLHISHLRKKIEHDSRKPELIKTVRGFGYVFAGTPVAV
tara:strand:- start:14734 stop:15462 length:729 start_codon:yes stop_codon:yes gene_type:complete